MSRVYRAVVRGGDPGVGQPQGDPGHAQG
jgi:hypothetical protein